MKASLSAMWARARAPLAANAAALAIVAILTLTPFAVSLAQGLSSLSQAGAGSVVSVPEPISLSLFASGVAGIALVRWRGRRK